MNNNLDTSKGTHGRRFTVAALAAGLLAVSSCGFPLPGEGEDISADVVVGGAEPANEKGNEARSESTIDTAGAQAGGSSSQDDETTPEDESTPTTADEAVDDGAPALISTVDARFNGRSMQYLGIDLQLGDFTTTNQTLQQYLGSLAPTDTDEVLLVELAVTNRSSGTVSVPREVLGLRLASGEWIPAAEMRESDGDTLGTVRPATQATERVFLEFPDVDLTGASFEISEATTIAESIALTADETAAVAYTIDLPGQAPTIGLESPSLWPSCGYGWTGEVLSARVTVEGVDGRQLERATKGQRWVAVEMRATYDATTEVGSSPCDDYGLAVNEIDPRLVIDGIPQSSVNSTSGDRIDAGTVVTTEFWFQIPVETQQIELTDVEGTRIAIWALDLPLVDGEE